VKKRLAEIETDDQPLSRKLIEVYEVFPGCLGNHIGEYIPYAYEFGGLEGLNFEGHLEQDLISALSSATLGFIATATLRI